MDSAIHLPLLIMPASPSSKLLDSDQKKKWENWCISLVIVVLSVKRNLNDYGTILHQDILTLILSCWRFAIKEVNDWARYLYDVVSMSDFFSLSDTHSLLAKDFDLLSPSLLLLLPIAAKLCYVIAFVKTQHSGQKKGRINPSIAAAMLQHIKYMRKKWSRRYSATQ